MSIWLNIIEDHQLDFSRVTIITHIKIRASACKPRERVTINIRQRFYFALPTVFHAHTQTSRVYYRVVSRIFLPHIARARPGLATPSTLLQSTGIPESQSQVLYGRYSFQHRVGISSPCILYTRCNQNSTCSCAHVQSTGLDQFKTLLSGVTIAGQFAPLLVALHAVS
ncbi:hypothetical protein BJX99DRAFT_63686 [Aspergillus californicus]